VRSLDFEWSLERRRRTAQPAPSVKRRLVLAESVLRWVLRITLPTLIGLSALLIYWISVDNVYKTYWLYTVLAMVPLVAIVAALALWTLVCWVSKELY
jgi:ABC-type transport system involved in Fe-S cluster assembly fused permease/ATPase subunit